MYDKMLYRFGEADALPVIENLPDPMVRPDGTRIMTAAEWLPERDRLKAMLEFYMFRDIPPSPGLVDAEIFESEPAHTGRATANLLRLTVRDIGSSGRDFSFHARQVLPLAPIGARIIVKNSGNHLEPCPVESRLVDEGIELVTFNRVEIAPDAPDFSKGIYPFFPGLQLKCLAAWAWGHMAVNTWLMTRGGSRALRPVICIVGHSRGGKATTAAGVFDERIDVATSSGSGCGGAGCFRFASEMDPKAEAVGNITSAFPFWFADRLHAFSGRESLLPFDLHTVT